MRRTYSCNLVADAVQVDLRFDAYFREYFQVPMPEKLKHLRSQKVVYARQDDRELDVTHPRLRIIDNHPSSHELYSPPLQSQP